MRLLEYKAKELLAKNSVPVPRGLVASTSTQAREAAERLACPVAIKAQVPVAGRGKAGGILFADTPEEAEEAAGQLLSTRIGGAPVNKVLVEEKLAIARELYFGVAIDRLEKTYVAIASPAGGVDIEETAEKHPNLIHRVRVDPFIGFQPYHARILAKALGYSGGQLLKLSEVMRKCYLVAMELDAELLEINPLVETEDGGFVAADAHIIIDDNALYRHPQFEKLESEEMCLSDRELEARRSGLAYVELDGDVGIIGNGAGLVMATLDLVKLCGGRPANFLDVGGGASAERMARALEIVASNPRVRVIFINILGGITRCDEIARGILDAVKRLPREVPLVIRLVGTMEEEGQRILRDAGIEVLRGMEEAAERAVAIAGGS